MELELKDKVALVTGASRGIGRAIALALAREGVQVALCSRKAGDLDDAAARIRQGTGAQALCVPGDLSTLAGVEAAVKATQGRYGRIDILINNAGAIRGGDFLSIPDEQRSALPRLARPRSGRRRICQGDRGDDTSRATARSRRAAPASPAWLAWSGALLPAGGPV